MRTTLVTTCLLVIARIAIGQSAPSNAEVLTIFVSADGVCHVLDTFMPCGELAQYLKSKHLAQDGHVHIAVDKTLKYDVVAATLKSLQGAGFKVGFVQYDPSQ